MDVHQQRVLQSHRRALAWCATNPGLIPPAVGPQTAWTPITRQLDTLNTVVIQSTDAAAQQAVIARQTTLEATDERALRQHLRDEMHAVAQVAHALRRTVPGIGILRMPTPGTQVERLLKAADAFTREAFTYETVLVEHGLGTDFIAQLRDAISALKASVDGRGAARAGQVSATKQLSSSLALGTKYISILDAAVTKALRTDAAKLAEWKHVKRVMARGVSATNTSSTTGATPMTVMPAAATVALTLAPAAPPAAQFTPDAKAA